MALQFLNDGYFAGTVGIGTDSPGAKLEVDGNVKIGDAATGATFAKSGTIFLITGVDTGGNAFNSIHLKADSLDTGLVIEKDTNNVGIGTTSPGVKLTVVTPNVVNTAVNVLKLGDDTNGLVFKSYFDATGIAWRLNKGLAGINMVTLSQGGNVGIGTTSPGYKLDVSSGSAVGARISTSGFTNLDLVSNRTSGNLGGLRFKQDIDAAQTGEFLGLHGGGFDWKVGDGSVVPDIKMRLDSSGKLGIGTTSPGANLDILNGITGASLKLSATATAYWQLQRNPTTGNLNISDDALGNVMSFDQLTGNVGIGVTPFASGLTNTVLDLAPVASVWGFGNSAYLNANAYHNGSWLYKSTASAGVLQIDGNSLTFRQAASGTVDTGITFDQPFVISEEGSVGIGTTNPIGKLEVQSSVVRTSVNGGADELVLQNAGYSGMTILANSTSAAQIHFGDSVMSNTGMIQYWNNTNSMAFATNGGAERMRITSGGNVGIGTTSPTNLLSLRKDVAGGDVAIYLQNYNSVVGSTDETVSIKFAHGNDGGSGYVGAKIVGGKEGDFESSPANVKGFMSFYTNEGSLTSQVEQMRIDSAGAIKFNAYGAGTLVTDASGNITAVASGIGGSGTTNSIPMFTPNGTTIGNSAMSQANIGTGTAKRITVAGARMTITGNGGDADGGTLNLSSNTARLGICTNAYPGSITEPEASLDVGKNARIRGSLNVGSTNEQYLFVSTTGDTPVGYVKMGYYGQGTDYDLSDATTSCQYTTAFANGGRVCEDERIMTFKLTRSQMENLNTTPKTLIAQSTQFNYIVKEAYIYQINNNGGVSPVMGGTLALEYSSVTGGTTRADIAYTIPAGNWNQSRSQKRVMFFAPGTSVSQVGNANVVPRSAVILKTTSGITSAGSGDVNYFLRMRVKNIDILDDIIMNPQLIVVT